MALLLGVWEDGETLSVLTEAETGALAPLDGPARARAQRLATETLRQTARAEAVLGPHLRRLPQPPLRALLRLAATELCALGAAPHGVVDDAVRRARRDPATAPAAGLVNAVLRKVAADGPKRWEDLPAPRMPGWLRGRVSAAFGNRAAAAIEIAHAQAAPLDLTARDDPAALAAATGGQLLSTGSVRLPPGAQVSALPGFAEGAFWVQDAAAALPVRLLAPEPELAVLDLCAAPGGKTLQLAAAGAAVTALDSSGRRLTRLTENLKRTGLAAEVLHADALDWRGDQFPAVLLDAPCSATGTIRRHPDLPWVRTPADLSALKVLQSQLLDRAVAALAPGGRLVYCTCSLLPEEGEEQIAAAITRHPGLRPDPGALAPEWIEPDWRVGTSALRVRPDHWPTLGGLDGFYIAILRRD